MDQTFMKEKKILPLIITMALPIVISMLISALYNIVDSYFVAKIEEDAMTALSLIYPLQNLANAIAIGFGIGITSVIAYSLGAGQQALADRAAALGLLMSVIHGVVIAVLCISFASMFIRAFTSSENIISYGLDYFYLVILFAPVNSLGMAAEKVLQAVGKMKTTMVCMAIGAVVNIVLDPFFIALMGVKGAALATGIGQTLSLISYFIVFWKAKLPVKFKLGHRGEDKLLKKMYLVGLPAALNLALPSFMITAMNAILKPFEGAYIMILGVYYKLQTFIYFTVSGVIQGIRPLVAYNRGAGEKGRVGKIFFTTLSIAAIVMLIGTLVCLICPSSLIGLYSKDPETVSQGATALKIICCGFIVSSVSVTVAGTFEGLGKGMPSLIISCLRYLLIILVAYLLTIPLGAVGVWHSFWITELISACVAAVLFWKLFKKA